MIQANTRARVRLLVHSIPRCVRFVGGLNPPGGVALIRSSRGSWPKYRSRSAEVLLRELVSLELRLRTEGGDTPTIPDYEERFPEQKTLIETLFHELTCLAETAIPGGPPPGGAREPDREVAGSRNQNGRGTRRIAEASSTMSIPETIGKYQVVERLGPGRSGRGLPGPSPSATGRVCAQAGPRRYLGTRF